MNRFATMLVVLLRVSGVALPTALVPTVSLPTEAQWEYACRAGTQTAYPWGNNPDDGKGWANCRDQSLRKKRPDEPAEWFFNWDDGFAFTSPVGSFQANAFGLYDMFGNAEHWCQDYAEAFYAIAYPDGTGAVIDPTGTQTGDFRAARGSSWETYLTNCFMSLRLWSLPDERINNRGFRVVVSSGGE